MLQGSFYIRGMQKGLRLLVWPIYQTTISQGSIGCTPNVRVPMVFIVFNLGILGDNLKINTHVI